MMSLRDMSLKNTHTPGINNLVSVIALYSDQFNPFKDETKKQKGGCFFLETNVINDLIIIFIVIKVHTVCALSACLYMQMY